VPRPDYTNPQILEGVTTTSSEILQNDFDAEEHETKEEHESHADLSWWRDSSTVDFSWYGDDPTEGEEE